MTVGVLFCLLQAVFGVEEDREMIVKGVTVDPISKNPVILLEDVDQSKAFPIWVGGSEAISIASELEGVIQPRPNSHDLMKSIVERLQGKLQRVVITEIRNNIYYAVLVIKTGASVVTVDARPSDAIALALRAKAPIFATQRVLSEAKAVEMPGKKKEVADQVKAGVVVQELTPELARHFQAERVQGLLVSEVRAGGPGERGGLRRGDIIMMVNGKAVQSLKQAETATGKGAVLQILRDGQIQSVTLPGGN
jgi:hypothetical protein